MRRPPFIIIINKYPGTNPWDFMENTSLSASVSFADTADRLFNQAQHENSCNTISEAYQVYLVTNSLNNMRYVGRTCRSLRERLSEHIRAARRGSTYRIHRAIREYGADNFVIQILEDDIPSRLIHAREKHWIAAFNTLKEGYNSISGGGGALGSIRYERRKIRNPNERRIPWNKGKRLSPHPLEMRQRISMKLRGRRSPMKGRKMTEATRQKMRESRLGALNPAYGRKRPDLAERNKIPQVWLRRNGIEKKVPLTQMSFFLQQGFEYGRAISLSGEHNPGFGGSRPDVAARNRLPFCWMNDGAMNRRVPVSEVEAFAARGFVRGQVRKSSFAPASETKSKCYF